MIYRSKVSWISAAALTTAFSVLSFGIQAKTSPDTAEYWDSWQAMGNGYVARRRVPAKADQPINERRLDSTQAKSQAGKPKAGARLIAAGKTELMPASEKGKSRQSLSLRTGLAGLHGIGIADLAARWGKSIQEVRDQASKGRYSLTNENDPVAWYFDEASDSLLFTAEAFDTFYTSKNVYKITEKYSKRDVMVVSGYVATGSSGVDAPFPETLKFEEEPDFFFATWTVASEPDADYWFWDYLYGGTRDALEVDLNIPDPAANGTAQLRITLRGWTDLQPGDDHQVYAELNGVQVGETVSWDAFDEAVLVANFNQNLLNATGQNVLTLKNSYTLGTTPGEWLDSIEIDYSRLPVATDGSLWMHDVVAGAQRITGFTSEDILVIESPTGTAVMREDVRIEADGAGVWAVIFETHGGVDFLVAQRDSLVVSVPEKIAQSSLRRNSNRAGYLIIAPRDFAGTAQALANYRTERFGDVKIVWLDEIYNEFSYGRVDPTAITRFMERVKKWSVQPSNVVLIGKGSLDEKNRMGYDDSFMPVVMTDTPWALAASDERLLAGEDTAAFAIGRLPITNDAEGIAYVDKLIDYESMASGADRYKAVLVADNPDEAGDFAVNSDLLAGKLLGTLGFDSATQLYHPDDAVREGFIASATWNAGYVTYDGHGSTTQVGDNSEKFISAEDAGLLSNTTYPIFTALTCAAGDDSYPGTRSLASALVLNPAGGAIASLAPTGLSLDRDAQILGNAFVDSLYGDNQTVGDAIRSAKQQTTGEISGFMPKMYSVIGDPGLLAR